jgi:hypothetical protein
MHVSIAIQQNELIFIKRFVFEAVDPRDDEKSIGQQVKLRAVSHHRPLQRLRGTDLKSVPGSVI